MAPLRGVFLDTSVLVAGTVDLGAASRAPFAVLDAVADGRIARPATAWHCCLEFFSVTTRLPEEYRLELEIAARFVEEEILGRMTVHGLPARGRSSFFARVAAQGIGGGGIYDAHIAEVARSAGARVVVSDNRQHFARLLGDEVRVLDSTAFAAEL